LGGKESSSFLLLLCTDHAQTDLNFIAVTKRKERKKKTMMTATIKNIMEGDGKVELKLV
jgi:hypothetical protein